MDKVDLEETIWSRGWHDAQRAILSFWGLIFEAGGSVVIGWALDPIWGVVWFVGIIAAIWIGATAGAPFKQRDEARNKILNGLGTESKAQMLEDLANELRQFIDRHIASRPGGEGDLSFVGAHQRNNPGVVATQDSIVLTGDDDDMARFMMIKHDDRRRHDQQMISEFISRFSGRIAHAVEIISVKQGGLSRTQSQIIIELRSLAKKTDYYYFKRSLFDRLGVELRAAAERMRSAE